MDIYGAAGSPGTPQGCTEPTEKVRLAGQHPGPPENGPSGKGERKWRLPTEEGDPASALRELLIRLTPVLPAEVTGSSGTEAQVHHLH